MNNTTKRYIHISILMLLLIFVGCEQGNEPEPLPEAPNERLAYALAAALGNPGVRESVHQAMDASPYVEHKLVLQEFLETPAGSDLQAALSEVLGGKQVLTDLLAELPTLDFYLPYETHRKTWEHANSNLWAVCEVDPDAGEGMAYHPDGSHEWLTSREEVLEAEIAALFTLHRAEPKMVRNPATTGGAPNIQDKENWKTAISNIFNYSADGVLGGNCEFYFESGSGSYATGEISVNPPFFRYGETEAGLPVPNLQKHPVKVNPERVSDSNPIDVEMWEADGGFNADDDYYGTFHVTGDGTYQTEKTEKYDDGVFPSAKVTFVIE